VGGWRQGTTGEDLCKALLKFIADFANWDLARTAPISKPPGRW
jgi:hypothetical protein